MVRSRRRKKRATTSTGEGDQGAMILRLAVFDLDYTVWQPEMYQLWGKPKLVPTESTRQLSPIILQEAKTKVNGHILIDPQGSPMRVFSGANHALLQINHLQSQGYEVRAAVASRTDEPAWAKICMDHLVVADENGHGGEEEEITTSTTTSMPPMTTTRTTTTTTTLADCFEDRIEISYGSKVGHLQRLRQKTGVAWNEMCFFDNEFGNIRDVSRSCPDVKCIYTPDGMTHAAWEEAKAHFGISL